MAAKRGATDPLRKDRILNATLCVIADVGVRRTTHRRIAEAAGVPLGSVTYHFSSLEGILTETFERTATSASERYETALAGATNLLEACNAVADIICSHSETTTRELIVMYELYAYAASSDQAADITRRWLARSRSSLQRHFSPQAARAIDALIEGWPIHQEIEGVPIDRGLVVQAVTAIAERFPAEA